LTLPVRQTIHRDTETFFGFTGSRVVETEPLNESTITAIAGICNNDVVERAVLGTTARHADYDHANS
jgi:hypothetical protein